MISNTVLILLFFVFSFLVQASPTGTFRMVGNLCVFCFGSIRDISSDMQITGFHISAVDCQHKMSVRIVCPVPGTKELYIINNSRVRLRNNQRMTLLRYSTKENERHVSCRLLSNGSFRTLHYTLSSYLIKTDLLFHQFESKLHFISFPVSMRAKG